MCYMMLPPCYLDNTEYGSLLLDNKDIQRVKTQGGKEHEHVVRKAFGWMRVSRTFFWHFDRKASDCVARIQDLCA